MLMAADLTKSGFLGVGPQSRIYARGSSFNGRFFFKAANMSIRSFLSLMLEDNNMKNLLDQGPTIFSKQNELNNSLYEQTLKE